MENDIVNKLKPQKRKKHLWRILIALVAVASAVGVFFLVKNLQNNADIKVGDTVITKSHIEKVSQQAEDYKKSHPNSVVDGDTAIDALVLNAGLKQYAMNKCGFKQLLGVNDVSSYFDEPSIKEMDTESFEYISKENLLYKNKLKDCLIQKKELFRVAISYATPYMQTGNTAEINAKHSEVRKVLNEKFMPLFKAGLNKTEISLKTDMDLLTDEFATKFDFSRFEREIITVGKSTKLSHVDGVMGGNYAISEIGDGNEVSIDEVIKKLSVGKHSDVVKLSSGEYAIIRVESKNDADFTDWDDFLKKVKESNSVNDKMAHFNDNIAYAATKVLHNEVCFAVSGNTWSCQGTGGSNIPKPGFYLNDKYEKGDFRHVKAIRFRIVDENGHPVNGVTAHSFDKARRVETRDVTSYVSWNGLNYAPYGWFRKYAFSGDGFAFGMGDCNGSGELETTFTAPAGYVFVDNGQRSMIVRNPIAGSNDDGITDKEYRIRKEVVPPPPDPAPTPATNQANASTKIAITKRSETPAHHTNVWRTGTVLAPVGHHISFKHEINGTIKRNNLSRIDMIWSTKRGKSRELNLGSKAEGLIVRQGNTTQLVNSSQDTPPDAAYWVTSRDTGTTICDNIRFDINHEQAYGKGIVRNGQQAHDRTVDGRVTTSGASAQACAYVPYEFGLTPCIANGISNCQTGDTPIEGKGKPPTFTPNISNGSGTPTPSGTIFKITTWHIPSIGEGAQTPTSGVDNEEKNTCLHYRNQFKTWAFLNCKAEESTRGFPSGQTNLNQYIPPVPPNAEIGSRYCVGVSVSAHTMRPDETEQTQKSKIGREWRHSAPLCVLIVKQPKLQIWGNGIYSLGGIRTSTSQRDGQNFGSWVEFEAITGRNVRGFGTAANLEGNKMTFTNTNPNRLGLWGNWQGRNNQHRLADQIRTRFGTESKGNAASRIWIENHGDVVLSGIDGTKKNFGNTHIIYAKNVTINGNITARSPWLSLANWFQQTIIIADNINISPNVTQIDAWLIAGNTINTCNVPDRDLNNNSCGRQLRVNGAVYAGQKLEARRTAGSGNGSPSEYSEPAEIFNQRPDAYFWARGHSVSPNKIVTTYTRELPARL